MAIGNPITLTSNVASKTINVIATASQSLFTVNGGYRINEIAVFRNGVRLVDGRDFTARDGLTVTLLSAATVGDVLEFQVFDTFRVADAITPFDSDQTISGDLNITGILSASQLGSVNFNVTSGIQTFHDVRVGGALTVAGVLTFDDVTNVDSVGYATFRSGINVQGAGSTTTTLNVTGVSTFSEDILIGTGATVGFGSTAYFRDNAKALFGDGEDLQIWHEGSYSIIQENGSGQMFFQSNGTGFEFRKTDGENIAKLNVDGSVELYHNNSKKFETTGVGVTVIGVTTSRGFVLAEDDGIHFRTTAANDLDAILRENSSNTLLINSRNDAILNIDSNGDSTDAHFAIGHGAATGSSTELFRVQEDGKVGVNTNDPKTRFHIHQSKVANAPTRSAALYLENDANCEIQMVGNASNDCQVRFGTGGSSFKGAIEYQLDNDALLAYVDGSERLRIDSGGRLLAGTTSDTAPGAFNAKIQTASTSFDGSISLRRDSNNTGAQSLVFGKSRGSLNGNTIVQSGDTLGTITFFGADGTDLNTAAAQMLAAVDGTPGSNDMPGRLVFSTTADGASSPTERLRILSGGQVNIGGNYTQTTYTMQVTGTFNATSNITQNGNALATNGKAIAMALIFG